MNIKYFLIAGLFSASFSLSGKSKAIPINVVNNTPYNIEVKVTLGPVTETTKTMKPGATHTLAAINKSYMSIKMKSGPFNSIGGRYDGPFNQSQQGNNFWIILGTDGLPYVAAYGASSSAATVVAQAVTTHYNSEHTKAAKILQQNSNLATALQQQQTPFTQQQLAAAAKVSVGLIENAVNETSAAHQ